MVGSCTCMQTISFPRIFFCGILLSVFMKCSSNFKQGSCSQQYCERLASRPTPESRSFYLLCSGAQVSYASLILSFICSGYWWVILHVAILYVTVYILILWISEVLPLKANLQYQLCQPGRISLWTGRWQTSPLLLSGSMWISGLEQRLTKESKEEF